MMQLEILWWNQTRLEDYDEQPQRGQDLPAFGASIKENNPMCSGLAAKILME